MAVTKQQKGVILADLKEKLQQSKSVIFAHYIGMTVSEVSELRSTLKKSNAEMKVAKKNLMRLAAKELNIPEPSEELLDGAVACIFSFEDPLSGAQVAFKFGKTHQQVELIGGIYEGKLISKEEAQALAKIPGKQQLLAMFAALCNGPLSSFARGLSELAKQKEQPETVAETPVEASTTPAPENTSAPSNDEPATPEAETTDKPDVPAADTAPETPPSQPTAS